MVENKRNWKEIKNLLVIFLVFVFWNIQPKSKTQKAHFVIA
jgi:preprotein translocase subunit YajC